MFEEKPNHNHHRSHHRRTIKIRNNQRESIKTPESPGLIQDK